MMPEPRGAPGQPRQLAIHVIDEHRQHEQRGAPAEGVAARHQQRRGGAESQAEKGKLVGGDRSTD